MEKLEDRQKYIILFSLYRNALTKKQRKYLELYLEDDLGFTEIGKINNVSRQAVHDSVNKALKLLDGYEQSVKLYEKYIEIIKLLNQNNFKNTDQIVQIFLESRENV